jgi:hypothetical protein
MKNMKPIIKICSAVVIFLAVSVLFSQEADTENKKERSLRFHSGTVLSAELLPENTAIKVEILNVSPSEPASRVTADVAYASVVVKLDPGRSISVYDYSLENRGKVKFKCIVVREGEDPFDAQKWELAKTSPDKRYTLLFKVEPFLPDDKCEYYLHFNLNKNINKNISDNVPLTFIKINRPFTSAAKIPDEGTLGVDPESPPPPKKEDPVIEKKEDPVPPAKEVETTSNDSMLKFVPAAKSDQLIYELDLVKNNDTVKYDVDNHLTFKKPFDRISYYLELKTEKGDLQYAYVSVDAFTDDLGKIGVPTIDSNACFQQLLTNMDVYSNVKDVVNGKGLKGNIEFWPNKYGPKNTKSVPNASATVLDFGDEMLKDTPYGSMQIHNYEANQTIFAYNCWIAGKTADLGLGNSTGKTLDWTSAKNAGSYTVKKIKVLVHPKDK